MTQHVGHVGSNVPYQSQASGERRNLLRIVEGLLEEESDEEGLEEDGEHVPHPERLSEGSGGWRPGEGARKAAYLYTAVYASNAFNELLALDPSSAYSAAIALPNIARSAGWTETFTARSIYMMVLALISFLVQISLLEFTYFASEKLLDVNGHPYLCTYGADCDTEQPGCDPRRGPFGVILQRDMSNLETDPTIAAIRNAIYFAFSRLGYPQLGDQLGPVDVGVESPECQALCILVLLISLVSKLRAIWIMACFLWLSPTTSQRRENCPEVGLSDTELDCWIEPLDASAARVRAASASSLQSMVDLVVFRMSGMPWKWKLWAWFLVFLRAVVVVGVASRGSMLLMSTGGVIDMIQNTLALNFIADLDELMLASVGGSMARDIMERLRPFCDPTDYASQSARDGDESELEDVIAKHCQCERQWTCRGLLATIAVAATPFAVVVAGVMLVYFMNLMHGCELVRYPGQGLWPWTQTYFGTGNLFAGAFWMGDWISRNRTGLEGQTTCAPYSPEWGRDAAIGCNLPQDWTVPA